MKMKLKFTHLKSVFFTIFIAILTCYFVYHTIYGDRGLIALAKLSNDVQIKQQELDSLTKERIKLENKINVFNDKNMDLDLLDQQVRKILGYADPEETVLIITKSSRNK